MKFHENNAICLRHYDDLQPIAETPVLSVVAA
jgi:hypothetical protein